MAMTLRLADDDERALSRIAEQEGLSRHAAVLRAIHEAAERRGHNQLVSEASKRGRDRYDALLKRLGE